MAVPPGWNDPPTLWLRRGEQPVHVQRPPPRLLTARLRHPHGGEQRGRGVQQSTDHGRVELAHETVRDPPAARRSPEPGLAHPESLHRRGIPPRPGSKRWRAGRVRRRGPLGRALSRIFRVRRRPGFTTDPALSRAHLDRFVIGEVVEDRDVPVWYARHFRHRPGHGGALVGPDLKPFNW
jgi:hypothetical protein